MNVRKKVRFDYPLVIYTRLLEPVARKEAGRVKGNYIYNTCASVSDGSGNRNHPKNSFKALLKPEP